MIAEREALRLRLGAAAVPLRAGSVEIAAPGGADVAGDAELAPAEIVGRGDVGEHVEAFLVAQMRSRLEQPGGIDDERRLAERLACLDQPGHALVAH